MVIGAFVLDLFPKAALAEMAGFGFTLGFDFFHVCGYTVIIIIILIIIIIIIMIIIIIIIIVIVIIIIII